MRAGGAEALLECATSLEGEAGSAARLGTGRLNDLASSEVEICGGLCLEVFPRSASASAAISGFCAE